MYSLDAFPLYIVAQSQRCTPSKSTAAAVAVTLLSTVLLLGAPVAAGLRRLLPLVLAEAISELSLEL
jgi:hypothetical protein